MKTVSDFSINSYLFSETKKFVPYRVQLHICHHRFGLYGVASINFAVYVCDFRATSKSLILTSSLRSLRYGSIRSAYTNAWYTQTRERRIVKNKFSTIDVKSTRKYASFDIHPVDFNNLCGAVLLFFSFFLTTQSSNIARTLRPRMLS
jgi:hypothetical protein